MGKSLTYKKFKKIMKKASKKIYKYHIKPSKYYLGDKKNPYIMSYYLYEALYEKLGKPKMDKDRLILISGSYYYITPKPQFKEKELDGLADYKVNSQQEKQIKEQIKNPPKPNKELKKLFKEKK